MKTVHVILWVTGVLSVVLFLVLAVMGEFWPKAEGNAIFDSRLAGYTMEDAVAYLNAVTAEQSGLYRRVFHKIDTLFPALLTFTMVVVIWRQSVGVDFVMRVLGASLPMIYMALDYTENWQVAQILLAGPGVSEELVRKANAATIGKWIALTIASLVTVWAWRVAAGKREDRL